MRDWRGEMRGNQGGVTVCEATPFLDGNAICGKVTTTKRFIDILAVSCAVIIIRCLEKNMSKFLKYGAPFLVLIVGGSFALKEFAQLR